MSRTRIDRLESADGSSVTERTYEVGGGFFGNKETLVSETRIDTSKEGDGLSCEVKAGLAGGALGVLAALCGI
jgi:hypothetical protein